MSLIFLIEDESYFLIEGETYVSGFLHQGVKNLAD